MQFGKHSWYSTCRPGVGPHVASPLVGAGAQARNIPMALGKHGKWIGSEVPAGVTDAVESTAGGSMTCTRQGLRTEDA